MNQQQWKKNTLELNKGKKIEKLKMILKKIFNSSMQQLDDTANLKYTKKMKINIVATKNIMLKLLNFLGTEL